MLAEQRSNDRSHYEDHDESGGELLPQDARQAAQSALLELIPAVLSAALGRLLVT